MSIDSEVTSMTQNLQADYEGLENIGADLTGINKNILNIRTILDTIYNDLPKVTGEGTEVTLTPTRKGRLALIPKGNSTQESTNGYNLVNYDNTPVTLIKSTARTINITPSNFPLTLEAGTYTISLPDSVFTNMNLYLQVRLYNNNSNNINTNFSNVTQKGTFTLSEQFTIAFIYVFISSNDNDNATATFSKIMLESGSTAHEWEQYTGGIPAPNPSYPIPIKSVTGNNNVVLNNKNLLELSNDKVLYTNTETYLINENDLDITIPSGGNTKFVLFDLGLIENYRGKTITLSTEENGGTTRYCSFINCSETGENRTEIGNSFGVTNTFTTYTINDTYSQTHLAVRLSVFGTGGQTYKVKKPQVEYGSTATSYVAHAEQTLPLNLGTIELNKIGNYQDYIYKNNDKWYKHNAVRKLELAISNMNNNENYPGWTGQTQILTDLNITSSNKDFDTSFALCNIRNGNNMCVCNTGGVLYLQRGAYGNDHTQTYWKTNYPNLIFTLYYGILAEHQFDIEITNTSLIEQLEEINKMQGYNGTTIITSTFDSTNAQMIISGSALKGE